MADINTIKRIYDELLVSQEILDAKNKPVDKNKLMGHIIEIIKNKGMWIPSLVISTELIKKGCLDRKTNNNIGLFNTMKSMKEISCISPISSEEETTTERPQLLYGLSSWKLPDQYQIYENKRTIKRKAKYLENMESIKKIKHEKAVKKFTKKKTMNETIVEFLTEKKTWQHAVNISHKLLDQNLITQGQHANFASIINSIIPHIDNIVRIAKLDPTRKNGISKCMYGLKGWDIPNDYRVYTEEFQKEALNLKTTYNKIKEVVTENKLKAIPNNMPDDDDDDSYQYPPQQYTPQLYPTQPYPPQQYPTQQYPTQQYPTQQYPPQQYLTQQYPSQSYHPQLYSGYPKYPQVFPHINS